MRIIPCVSCAITGFILGSVGVTVSDWQLYAVLVIVSLNYFSGAMK